MDYTYFDSPIGKLLIAGDAAGIRSIDLPKKDNLGVMSDWREDPAPFRAVIGQLTSYFEGRLTAFDLPLAPRVTAFQERVLRALREVAYGATVSYGELARLSGRPGAARAVGMANAHNPIPIIIPCHRVIGARGDLTGYGGGLEVKRWLLSLEARRSAYRGSSARNKGLWAFDTALSVPHINPPRK